MVAPHQLLLLKIAEIPCHLVSYNGGKQAHKNITTAFKWSVFQI